MDVADYLLGSAALTLGLVPWVIASQRLARRLLPDREGAVAALAASIIGISGVVVVAELVGVVDGLRRWPFAVVSAAVAAGVAYVGRGPDPSRALRLRLPRSHAARLMLACVGVCVIATSASLLGRDAAVVGTGPLDLDSLHYHLSQAAQMVQVHNIDHLHHTASSDGTVYYPYDAELLDAVGMLGPRPDIAIFGLNLLFGWLALLACWVIGARWSRGAPALAAGAAVLALPIVSRASSGPGLNDIPAMAFVLSAVALVAGVGLPRGSRDRRAWGAELAVAGAALGLAAGTKLNALPVVILVAVVVVVLATSDRRVAVLALVAPSVLTGGFWYVRDWIAVGSPVPDLNLTVAGHGFHVVPYPEVKPYAYTVAHYLDNGTVIRNWFEPGLRAVWTGQWRVVGVLIVLGVVVSLFDRSWLRRLLAIVVAIGFVAYAVTPTTAIGDPNAPVLFATNTRYALPSIVLAIVLLASSPRLRRLAPVLTLGFTVLTVVLIDQQKLPQQIDYAVGIAIAIVLVLLLLGACDLRQHSRAALPAVMASAIAVVAVVGGVAAVQRHYVQDRYAANTPEDKLFRLVGGFRDVRIGVAGHGLEYPLYGRDFTNVVNYIGVSAPSHAFDGPTSCQELLRVLAEQHDDYAVVEPLPVEHTDRIDRWLSGIPGVSEIFPGYIGHVYRLPATIPADGCLASE
ncbi:MAG TPA: hypothetical protein VG899_04675 [Mycobacteriales bacterium]|nr:hypothetical protein [Mycobacteriales bacterium]